MDSRPSFAVGHIQLRVNDVGAEMAFYLDHGLREIVNRKDFGILELRGGTHLVLNPVNESEPATTQAPFDLMADDIDAAHARFVKRGDQASDIEHGNIHSSFTVQGPSGYSLRVTSSHVAGPV
ncbi:MAG: VOC family protein [Gammaproteobacteria bacterium]|nr:VOC family protein [Gammaproteobacteria bacterium]MYD79921.1 VOC family protein [Gammaproteobacteria bacterium]